MLRTPRLCGRRDGPQVAHRVIVAAAFTDRGREFEAWRDGHPEAFIVK
jgi:hypothetical protein